jgi:predicted ester cyclase
MSVSKGRAEVARRALEEICSGKHLAELEQVYHPDFTDHVNQQTYRGHEGARRSIARYQALFDELSFSVDDQVVQGEKVASRWTLHGRHHGRPVELHGIVISRFEGDRIVEDWAVSDTVELLRQLGIRRSMFLPLMLLTARLARTARRLLRADGLRSGSRVCQ